MVTCGSDWYSMSAAAGTNVPLIHKFNAGYSAGVRAVCGDCTIHVAYAGTTPEAFRDPVKGKALAVSQIAAGADVIYQAAGTTGHGVFEASRDMGVSAIGVDSDPHDEMPGTVITSMLKRGDVAVFDVIHAVGRGEWKGGITSFGLAENGVSYVSEGSHGAAIPTEVRARVAELRDRIVRGEIGVPTK